VTKTPNHADDWDLDPIEGGKSMDQLLNEGWLESAKQRGAKQLATDARELLGFLPGSENETKR
jgi:hypothetical protein